MNEEYDGSDLVDTPPPFERDQDGRPKDPLPVYREAPLPPIRWRQYATVGPGRVLKELRTMVLEALEHEGGVDYLRWVARNEPKAFAGLLGKVLPMQITGRDGGPVQFEAIERVIVDVPHNVVDITPNDKT